MNIVELLLSIISKGHGHRGAVAIMICGIENTA